MKERLLPPLLSTEGKIRPPSKASKWAFLQMRGNGYGNMALKIKFQSRIWNREAAFFSSALSLLDYQLAIQVSWELQVKKGLVIMPLPLFSLLLGVVPNLISESHFYFSCAVTATEAASKARKLVVILELPSTTTHHTKKTSLCIRGKTISHQCFLCSKTP